MYRDELLLVYLLNFNDWCPLKGQAATLFKYVWSFSGHQALKGQQILAIFNSTSYEIYIEHISGNLPKFP